MTTRILRINYIRLAELLCERLEAVQDPDAPRQTPSFEGIHQVLTRLLENYDAGLNYPFYGTGFISDHLTERYALTTEMGNIEDYNEITDILFADLGTDHFEDALLSNLPGSVVRVKEDFIAMPLVLIKVS